MRSLVALLVLAAATVPQSAVIRLCDSAASDLATGQAVPITRDPAWRKLEKQFAAEQAWIVRLTAR
jgi:hypothetical protein